MPLLNPRAQGSQDDADPDWASFAQRCEELARENVSLQVKVARLQKENHYLRRAQKAPAQMKPQMRRRCVQRPQPSYWPCGTVGACARAGRPVLRRHEPG